MPETKVVITDLIDDELEIERDVLGDLATVEACGAEDEQDLVGWVEDAAALIVYHNIRVTSATIDRLADCKLIIRGGVGTDNVDIAAATARGIPVANVPDYGAEEVADSAMGMMLTLAHGIHLLNARMRENSEPWTYAEAVPLARLRGEVFGIVGLGRIGTAVAQRAKVLGMDVVFYDPYKPDGYDKALGIRREHELAALLAQSYAVSFHCPLTDETRDMINRESIELMRRGSYMINTARGEVVDASVILAAIESGRLAGAAIDVLAEEPPSGDMPLLVAWRDPQHPAHNRVIVNPHSSFYCEEGLAEIRVKTSSACKAALLGQLIRTVVN